MCIGKEVCDENLNKDCGIIDTKNNHLFVDSHITCPITEIYYDAAIAARNDGNKIITRIILSETVPDIHEWKEYFVSLENFENKESKEYKNLKKKILKTRKKGFKKLLNDNLEIYTETSLSFNGDSYTTLNLHPKAKIKVYTTNYIGFGSKSDLENFIEKFDRNDPTNNPLYKFGKKVFPSLETILCASVLCALFVIYLIFFSLKSFKSFLWLLIIKECVLGATFFIFLGIYIWQLNIIKKIKIDMDYNFQKILDLYNNRRMQYYLLSALILLFISIIPFLIFLIIELIQKCKDKSNQPPENSGNQVRAPQNNPNGNSPSQYQALEDQQTIEQPNSNQNRRNSENQQLNVNNNITENEGEVNGLVIHKEKTQIK